MKKLILLCALMGLGQFAQARGQENEGTPNDPREVVVICNSAQSILQVNVLQTQDGKLQALVYGDHRFTQHPNPLTYNVKQVLPKKGMLGAPISWVGRGFKLSVNFTTSPSVGYRPGYLTVGGITQDEPVMCRTPNDN